jgi:putative sporulation protein YyaC
LPYFGHEFNHKSAFFTKIFCVLKTPTRAKQVCAPLFWAILFCEVKMIPVIVCFGTKNVSGDSLAPEVGTLLKYKHGLPAFVYGDLVRPIDALHAEDAIRHIKSVHPNSVIISVDACVGKEEDIGKIRVRRGGVRPAEVLDKKIGAFGDVGILGIVSEAGDNPLPGLMTVSPLKVSEIANKIALLLKYAVLELCS